MLRALLIAAVLIPTVVAAASTLDLKGLGSPTEACTAFDGYVNGLWSKSTPIPADKARIGSFDTLRDESRDVVEQALIDAARDPSLLDTPGKLLAARFYISGMDAEAVEKPARGGRRGATPRRDAGARAVRGGVRSRSSPWKRGPTAHRSSAAGTGASASSAAPRPSRRPSTGSMAKT